MRRRQFILTGVAALYFGALIGTAFVPSSALNRSFWCWEVLAFLPVGTLLLLLMGRRRWWAAIAFGMLGAAWLEAAQSVWMPVGYASAMDVVWASAGSTAGVLVAFVASSPRARSMRTHEPHRIIAQAGNREIPQD
jgi:glycopeptide antibiotics resistance protein